MEPNPAVKEVLDQIGKEHKGMRDELTTIKGQFDPLNKNVGEIQKELAEIRRVQLAQRANNPFRPKGQVSHEAAVKFGSRFILQAAVLGALAMEPHQKDAIIGVCKENLGINTKATLTSSDIPQLVEYGPEVVELVSDYGLARRVGSIYPMGADTLNLSYLSTDTAFGLIAAAAAITEKSPAQTGVTIVAKKWGGIVRFPREIDEGAVAPLGQFIARYAARNFAKIEDIVFFTADGSGTYGSISGLTKVVDVAATRTVTASNATAGGTLANFRAMRTQVASAALRMGAYYLHPTQEAILSALNTGGDKPYRTGASRRSEIGGSAQAGVLSDATLDGFPIIWCDTLPAASATSAVNTVYGLFGDASFMFLFPRRAPEVDVSDQAYWTTDEIGVRCLERFSAASMVPQTAGNNAMSGIKTAAA